MDKSGENFMAESHFRQPGFTYCSCGPFTKHCTFYKNQLDKACFTHYVAYVDNKSLAKRTIWDKLSNDVALNPKFDGYQRG